MTQERLVLKKQETHKITSPAFLFSWTSVKYIFGFHRKQEQGVKSKTWLGREHKDPLKERQRPNL